MATLIVIFVILSVAAIGQKIEPLDNDPVNFLLAILGYACVAGFAVVFTPIQVLNVPIMSPETNFRVIEGVVLFLAILGWAFIRFGFSYSENQNNSEV